MYTQTLGGYPDRNNPQSFIIKVISYSVPEFSDGSWGQFFGVIEHYRGANNDPIYQYVQQRVNNYADNSDPAPHKQFNAMEWFAAIQAQLDAGNGPIYVRVLASGIEVEHWHDKNTGELKWRTHHHKEWKNGNYTGVEKDLFMHRLINPGPISIVSTNPPNFSQGNSSVESKPKPSKKPEARPPRPAPPSAPRKPNSDRF